MHGNAREWCHDWYKRFGETDVENWTGPTTGSYRVSRGGGWLGTAGGCRSAYRYQTDPSNRDSRLGFRVASVPSSEPGKKEDGGAESEGR